MKYTYELKKLSVTHNAIADWLIANPGKAQQGKCAEAFGITQSWLSTLIGQDAFQSLLKVKQDGVFEEVIVPLQDKIAGVANASVEKLGLILDATQDGRLVKDINDSMLKALGYGAAQPAGGITINNNSLTINQAALQEARDRQTEHYGRSLESKSEALESPDASATKGVPHHKKLEVGEARDLRSEHVNRGAEVEGDSPEGGEV